MSQSDEEMDTDFESDSDYLESDQASEKKDTQVKYAFLPAYPLYETHPVSISKSKNLVPKLLYYNADTVQALKKWQKS